MDDWSFERAERELGSKRKELTLSTGMGIVGDLGSNGFRTRNRVNTGVSLKSLVGAKNLLDAISWGGGTHARSGGEKECFVVWSSNSGAYLGEFFFRSKRVFLKEGVPSKTRGRLMESVPHARAGCMRCGWAPVPRVRVLIPHSDPDRVTVSCNTPRHQCRISLFVFSFSRSFGFVVKESPGDYHYFLGVTELARGRLHVILSGSPRVLVFRPQQR